MARRLGIGLCVALAAGAIGLLDAASSAQVDGAAELGERLYRRDCASCHGPDGEGTHRGVPLTDAGAASAHFYLSTGRMPIADPTEEIERSDPAYTETEITGLVAFVASLGEGPALPIVAGGDVSLGGSLYRLHCAQCHSTSGIGIALAAGVTAPSVLASTPTQVAEALVIGPGAMPKFAPGVLGEAETASVVAYVEELQSGGDPGGYPMARSGRMDEMLAAWGVGAVLMLLAVRTIARRR